MNEECTHTQVSSNYAEMSVSEALKCENDGFLNSSKALRSLSMDAIQKELTEPAHEIMVLIA